MAQRPDDPKPEDQTEGKEAAENQAQSDNVTEGGEAAAPEAPDADRPSGEETEAEAAEGGGCRAARRQRGRAHYRAVRRHSADGTQA